MRNRGRGIFWKKLIIIMMCIVLIIPVAGRAKTVWELENKKKEMEEKKAQLLQENKRLKEEYQEATSLENIERIAREKLGMIKEGEKPLVFSR